MKFNYGLTQKNLQPYKEKDMNKNDIQVPQHEQEEMLLGWVKESDDKMKLITHPDYELKADGDNIYLIKKKSQYPKTYEECCKVLFPNSLELGKVLVSGYKQELLKKLGELQICRDAYWEITGNPYDSKNEDKTYCIFYNRPCNKMELQDGYFDANAILDFATKEARDAFYENFKDLIEQCKELL